MFKELKISSGINIFIGVFLVLVLFLSGYSLMSSMTMSKNFGQFVHTQRKNDDLVTAVAFVLDGSSRINP